ncbi:MAG: 30S ribosomal protein S11 [Sphingobacteriales bacterium]|nr:MAG: 30S ribosomal protein S11 [Sphingobacteriales bacterium]
MAKTKKVTKKRVVIIEPVGQAHINASFNNIIITLTNNQGQTISWSSAGKQGFKIQIEFEIKIPVCGLCKHTTAYQRQN